jgi:hypothetical protein
MALITCHECGHRVSTEAAACPGCGAPPRPAPIRAAVETVVAVSAPAGSSTPTPASGASVERRADPPASTEEPSLAWIGWISGVFLLLVVALIALAPRTQGAESATAAYQSIENRRAVDSISVLSLTTVDSTMPADTLVRLESTLHANAFTIPHDAAHTRYTRIVLDSADALVASGLTFAARGLLGSLGNLPVRADSVRAARLNVRIARVEAEQARESARQQRLAQEQAAEARIERIRGLRQGNCTPPARAVRNRVRRNPEWSDEIIATTACNRVHLGMTAEQAIAGWGRPRDINRTSGSFGVHEQWVYGEYGSGYLYFEDGVLTTIQN